MLKFLRAGAVGTCLAASFLLGAGRALAHGIGMDHGVLIGPSSPVDDAHHPPYGPSVAADQHQPQAIWPEVLAHQEGARGARRQPVEAHFERREELLLLERPVGVVPARGRVAPMSVLHEQGVELGRVPGEPELIAERWPEIER